MASVQQRPQLKRPPLDTWNVREQLCLASSVERNGDQNWMSVSRSLRSIGDPNRPADWYNQKACAAQYGALLEHSDTPKRKKRSSDTGAESPQESILKRLTQERMAEIQKVMADIAQQYQIVKEEIAEVRNPNTSEARVREMCASVDGARRQREREQQKHAVWLKEREERRRLAERVHRPTASATPGASTSQSPPASSPLLTSLLKNTSPSSTPTTPTRVLHIPHPPALNESVSPSAGAPTLSMLLEKGHTLLSVTPPAPAAVLNTVQVTPQPQLAPAPQATTGNLSPFTSGNLTLNLSQVTPLSKIGQVSGRQGQMTPGSSSQVSQANLSQMTSLSEPTTSGNLSQVTQENLSQMTLSQPTTSGNLSQVTHGNLGRVMQGNLGQVIQGNFGAVAQGNLGQVTQESLGQVTSDVFNQMNLGQITQVNLSQVPQGNLSQVSQGNLSQLPQGNIGIMTQGSMGQVTSGNLGQVTTSVAAPISQPTPVPSNKHAVIEQIKNQLQEIEHTLRLGSIRGSPSPVTLPPPVLPPEPPQPDPADKVDIDDIEIKAEDVYAFSDIDIDIPPVSTIHKSLARSIDKSLLSKKEDDVAAPADLDTAAELTDQPQPATQAPPPPLASESTKEWVPEPPPADVPPEAPQEPPALQAADDIAAGDIETIPAACIPLPPACIPLPPDEPPPAASVPQTEKQDAADVQQTETEAESVERAEPTPRGDDTVCPPPKSPEAPETPPMEEVTKEPSPVKVEPAMLETENEEPNKLDKPEKENQPEKESQPEEVSQPEKESQRVEESQPDGELAAPPIKEQPVEPKREESESKEAEPPDPETGQPNQGQPEEKKEDEEWKKEGVGGVTGASGTEDKPGEAEETHTETDDDTPMEVIREEEKGGRKRRDYSRRKTQAPPDSRACSESESTAETSAPSSPVAPAPSGAPGAGADPNRDHRLWKKPVMLVYNRLCAHKYASLFLRPITDEQAPEYSKVVRRPMDLTTIKRNIEAGVIRTTAELQRDVLLMLCNALMYNPSTHRVHLMAQEMHREAAAQLGMLLQAQAHAALADSTAEPPVRRSLPANKRKRPASPHLGASSPIAKQRRMDE